MGIVDIEDITLSEQHEQITVIHETSVSDPYLYAPLDLNPLDTHNHTGFLYISNQPQYLTNLSVHVSPGAVQSGQPVLITVSATDNLGNPVPNALLSISYGGQALASIMTNNSGEGYYTLRPAQTGSVIVGYGNKSAQASICVYAPSAAPTHLAVAVSPNTVKIVNGAVQGGPVIVNITMSDYLWNPDSGPIVLSYTDSGGHTALVLNVINGVIAFNYVPLAVIDQVQFVATYNDTLSAWDTLSQVAGGS
jgi:hypothetical protein